MKKVWKTAWKVTGAACMATGIVVASGVVACIAATGSVAGGFVKAKKAVEDMFAKEDMPETAKETEPENAPEEAEVTEKHDKEESEATE